MLTHRNSYPGSRIKEVTARTTGYKYPDFMIEGDGWHMPPFLSDQIADFLNDATGIDGGGREISEELEAALCADFSDVLQKAQGGRYLYTGAIIVGREKLIRPHNMWAGPYKELKQKYYERESLISDTHSIGIQQKRGDFTSDEAQSIGQHEVGLTNRRSTKPILGTTGAGPCIIVAAYNREIGQALLTHVDFGTDLNSLSEYLDKMGGSASNKLEIHLHGGDNTTREQMAEIVGLIKQRSDTKIISAELCTGTGGEAKRLALDSRTGEVFTIFDHDQLHRDKMYPGIQPRGTPLILSFDGTREAMGKFTASVDDRRAGGGEVSRGGKRTEPTKRADGLAENS